MTPNEDEVDTSAPHLVEGAADHWLEGADWSPEAIAARNPNATIGVWVFGPDGGLPIARIDSPLTVYVDFVSTGDASALAAVAARLEGTSGMAPEHLRFYSGSIGMDALSPACRTLADRSTLPHLGVDSDADDLGTNLWVGRGGASVGLHWDAPIGYLVQLVGHKEALIFAPDQRRWLYPEPAYEGPNSPVNAFDPDLDRHPRFRHAEGVRLTAGPGDVVVIPHHWWHCFRALDDVTVSVNVWFSLPSPSPKQR